MNTKLFINGSYNFIKLIVFLVFLPLTVISSPQTDAETDAETDEKFIWQRHFDEQDRISKLINPAGQVTSFTYDLTDNHAKVFKTDEDGKTIRLEFDNKDRIQSMSDDFGIVNYYHDHFGRLSRLEREGEPEVNFTFDTENRITNLSFGEYYKIDYSYDFLGRLSSMQTPAGKINYEYQTGYGKVIRTLPNGIKTIWEFSANGQPVSITHLDMNNYIIAEYNYQYRPDGLVGAIMEKSQLKENISLFEYDYSGQLIRVSDRGGNEYRFEYDQLGNRISSTFPGGEKITSEFDWAGKLLSFNESKCSYDKAGNLNKIDDGSNIINYGYNQNGQLISVNNKIFYKYDGNGFLKERKVKGESKKFINNPFSDIWEPLVIENKDEKTLIIWDRNVPLIILKDDKPEFILTDHLGSARFAVNGQGKVIQNIEYTPFGELNGDFEKDGIFAGFSGLFYDPDANLYITKSRAYNPIPGQFMQIEPVQRIPDGLQKNISLYAYCGNDPINYTDRGGSWPNFIWGPENWAWQVFHTDWFDRDYAKNFYAKKEDYSNNSAMSWIWGTIGGYIPGEAKSIRQKYISDIWDFVPVVSTGRTFVSSLLNAKEGNIQGSFSDIISLGIGYIGDTKNLDRIGKNVIKTNLEKYITNNSLQNTNYAFVKGKRIINVLSNIELLSTAGNKLLDYKNDLMYAPSNVGGVYLGGAGELLQGMDQIKGLTFDENNNVIILSKSDENMNLPPMRLDDIVTVFRSTYIYGTGPTVTIDPNPDDPEKSAMIIKHDEGTKDTYVGWILYQCDRLMKCYMLGYDNITTEKFDSKVPGYEDIVNSMYFDCGFSNSSTFKGNWERFWIVPAQVNKFRETNSDVTIFDVTLKVNTQIMKWDNEVLVDDSNGNSSSCALKFIEWFTKNYDRIADEQFLIPPPETGLNEPVPVFKELKRIALLTAISEQMRDQNIPLPFWMREHEIKKVDIEKYTPAMEVTRNNGMYKSKIFGGVELSPVRSEVKQYAKTADLNQLREDERLNGQMNLQLSNELSQAVTTFSFQSNLLQPAEIQLENETFNLTGIPGQETKALAPCRINEPDMIVPITDSRDIRLTRHFNSFFKVKDNWGESWTMDLPRLDKAVIPEYNEKNEKVFKTIYDLVTPLNSMYVRFSDIKDVPELQSTLQVPDIECDFFGLTSGKTDFLTEPTLQLVNKNGAIWHFTENGNLIATEENGLRTVYIRNEDGNLSQIAGLMGKNIMATIDLIYDNSKKLVEVRGRDMFEGEQVVYYEYDVSGMLCQVRSELISVDYRYKDLLVSEITRKEKTEGEILTQSEGIKQRSFEYNEKGQIITEYNDNQSPVTFVLESEKEGNSLKLKALEGKILSSIKYDNKYRPIFAFNSKGEQFNRTYSSDGSTITEIKDANGVITKITDTANGMERIYETLDQPVIREMYDKAGRLNSIHAGDEILLSQSWYPDGLIESVEIENCITSPQYDEYGLIENIIKFPEGSGNQLEEWHKTEYDLLERPVKITDFTGLDVNVIYDKSGDISQLITEREGKNFGYTFFRNDEGLIKEVKSSWGNEQYLYDSEGNLLSVNIEKSNASKPEKAEYKFNMGKLKHILQFDGGEMEIGYRDEIKLIDLPSQVKCPNGLVIDYFYDYSGKIENVGIGRNRTINLEYDDKERLVSFGFRKN